MTTGAGTDTLIIGGGFFGYVGEIRRALNERGRVVAFYEDRPSLDTLSKTMIRLAPALIAPRADRYFARITQEMRDQPVRDVLVIKGESLSLAAITAMRKALPAARFTLYFWDSYRNMPKDSPLKVALFDRAFSFDPLDARRDPRLHYRPLFFADDYRQIPQRPRENDLLFVGTVHTDRYAVLSRLSQALPSGTRFRKVLFFPSTLLYYGRKLADRHMWHAKRGEFVFEPLSKHSIQDLVARSKTIVDIERPVQAGFTMRSIEALGAGRKLISTNPEMSNADFFDPINIAVIDRDAPRLSPEFLHTEYQPPAPELIRRYSLSAWLDEVLS